MSSSLQVSATPTPTESSIHEFPVTHNGTSESYTALVMHVNEMHPSMQTSKIGKFRCRWCKRLSSLAPLKCNHNTYTHYFVCTTCAHTRCALLPPHLQHGHYCA